MKIDGRNYYFFILKMRAWVMKLGEMMKWFSFFGAADSSMWNVRLKLKDKRSGEGGIFEEC